MDITQIYVFFGPEFVKRANFFLQDMQVKQNMTVKQIKVKGTYIAIVGEVRWSMGDELWQVYEGIVGPQV